MNPRRRQRPRRRTCRSLLGFHRAHIDNLVATLSNDEIVERAANELHRLVARIVVRAGGRRANGQIFGNLVVLLAVAESKNAVAYWAAAFSLNLVAGAGNQRFLRKLAVA